jgi:hypothetical protein
MSRMLLSSLSVTIVRDDMRTKICDLCKQQPKGDLWTVQITDGEYCYECAVTIEYEEA